MGPVVKTYGGYKHKRRGLPKFVVKDSLETTGNVFSALHIDNLKAIRGDDKLKSKRNVTKTITVREAQPTFDDSMDSTFDKILKSDQNKQCKEASLHSNSEKKFGLDSSNQCRTCGRIPTINMAHHVFFECSEDSYFLDPSPRSKRIVARKLKQLERKSKRVKLQKLTLSLKENPDKRRKTVVKAQCKAEGGGVSPTLQVNSAAPNLLSDADYGVISPVKSPFKTPNTQGSWLCQKSCFTTSTPDGCPRKPKFSIQTSPILLNNSIMKIEDQECPQLAKNVQSTINKFTNQNISKDFDKVPKALAEPIQGKKERSEVNREQNFVDARLKLDQTPTEDISKMLPLARDNIQNELSEEFSKIKLDTHADQSQDLFGIEYSIVGPSQLHCPSGYITKRRMWRKTRRTAINLSVDMFKSITKSTFDNHSSNGNKSSISDKVHIGTSKKDKSFLRWKEQPFSQQHFSIALDVGDVSVTVTRPESSCVNLYANESYIECVNVPCTHETFETGGKVSVEHPNMDISVLELSKELKDSNVDLSVLELSKELKVCLSELSSKNRKETSALSTCGSDVDMFESSSGKSKCHFQSFKSNLSNVFKEQRSFSQSNNIATSHLSELPLSSLITKHTTCSNMDESVKSSSNVVSLGENLCESGTIRETAQNRESVAKALSSNEFMAAKLLGDSDSVALNSWNVDVSQNSSNLNDVSKANDCSFEVVLKPCFVKLHRCDTQTIANVTYASQKYMSGIEDDHQIENVVYSSELLTESDHSTNFSPENNTSLNTVVKLPLSLLGKLDTVTVRGRGPSIISQRSFESFVQNGNLLEQTVAQVETQLGNNESAEEHHEISHADKGDLDCREVLSRCGQTEPLPFGTCYPESMLSRCKKIGEGAYGEVFLYNAEKQKAVIKVIPIEGDIEINAAAQKKFGEIKPEIIVAQELSALRKCKTGSNSCDIFNQVLAVRCVRGKYPQWMLDLWRAFDEERGSDNDCPDVFGDDQLFIVLELAHGGRDLESYEFTSADQGEAAVTQIAFALAVGESEIQFEHRDLHWGNVLVAPTKAKAAQFTLGGEKYKVATKGVKVSIIDFTMSRMTMPTNGENMFYDFGHDEELFAAQGDYQCDIYRLMRERTRNNWSVYEPFTNILWLHYLLDKMCSMVAYRNENTKTHQKAMTRLENMRDSVLAYSSATAFSASEFFKSAKVR